MDNKTSFDDKCGILADLWMTYRNETSFSDFISYNDVGLPLSWATTEGMTNLTENGKVMIEETFAMLLEILGVEDEGFDTLDDVLGNASIE